MSAEATLVVFTVGPSAFGVDAARVREVLWLPELSPAEQAPAAVVGVFSLRGQAVPVVDLRARFGHPTLPYRTSANVIVLETAGGVLGVLADQVRDVAVTESMPDAHEVTRDLVLAEAQAGDALVMVLDVDEIWPRAAGPASSPEDIVRLFPDALSEPVLRERARGYAEVEQPPPAGGRLDLAIVQLNDELFGLPLDLIREVAPIETLARIPCCPAHVLGSMNLRGELVTVMDVRAALGLRADDPAGLTELAVCGVDDQLLGLAVNAVIEIVAVEAAAVFPPPASTERVATPFVTGEITVDAGIVTLVDLPALIAGGGLDVDEVV